MYKFTFLMIALLGATNLFAQNEAYEDQVVMSLGAHNAFIVNLDDIIAKDALDYWEDYFKNESARLKRNRKADEYYAMATNVPMISSQKLDVYSKVEDLKANSRVYVWFDNQGAFIDSKSQEKEAEGALLFLNNFAEYAAKERLNKIVKYERSQLTSLEKDLNKLEKNKSNYEKEIEKAKKKIIENEANIEQNILDQQKKNEEIEMQKKRIDEFLKELKNVGEK